MAVQYLSNVQLNAGLKDGSGSLGSAGKLLISTGSKVAWASGILYDDTWDILNVSGKVRARELNLQGTGTSTQLTFSESGYAGHTVIKYNGTGTGPGNYLAFFSNTANWSTEGSGLNFIPENGRVGIGTITPSYPLDVDGSAQVRGKVIAKGTSAGFANINYEETFVTGYGILGNRGAMYINNADTDGKIYIGSGGTHGTTNTLALVPGNKVGINNPAPTYTLDVTGNVRATTSLRIEGASSLVGRVSVGSTTSSDIDMLRNGTNYISATGTGGNFIFRTGIYNRLAINNDGKVGIGTVAPTAKLHVSGDTRSDGSITAYGTLEVGDTGGDAVFKMSSSSTNFINVNSSTGSLCFSTNSVPRMKIASDGKVGIGITYPTTYKLEVDSNMAITGSSPGLYLKDNTDNDDHSIYFTNATSSILHSIQTTGSDFNLNTFNSSDIKFNVSNSTKLIVRNNGNIGIGTDTPDAKLEVSGASSVLRVGPRYTSGSDRDYVEIAAHNTDTEVRSNNERFHIKNTGGDLALSVTDGRAITVKSNTAVGVGTDNPQANLHVLSETITNVVSNVSYTSTSGSYLLASSTATTFPSVGDAVTVVDSSGNLIEANTVYFVDLATDRIYIQSTNSNMWNAAEYTFGTIATEDTMLIESTNNNSDSGPVFTLKRNSSSTSNGDYLGQLKFKGDNDNGGEVVYAKMTAKISDDTNNTEDGLIEYALKSGGSNKIVQRLTGSELKLINGTGLEVDGNIDAFGTIASGDINCAGGDGYRVDGEQVLTLGSEFRVGDHDSAGYDTFIYAQGDIGLKVKSSEIEVPSGDIILGGTGRIQGIDTVSSSTDAANKAYVDAAVSGGSGVTAITAGDYITKSGTSNVTINVDPEEGLVYQADKSIGSAAGPGWLTVAQATTARKHGKVYVTDGESGDHSFIEVDWMRSYGDSNWTVVNSGGHSNRITGVRVLSDTSDRTYGIHYLQVYVTISSAYTSHTYRTGDLSHFGGLIATTPIIQNTISGYSLDGSQITNLEDTSLATDQGIAVGGSAFIDDNIEVGGTMEVEGNTVLSGELSVTDEIETLDKITIKKNGSIPTMDFLNVAGGDGNIRFINGLGDKAGEILSYAGNLTLSCEAKPLGGDHRYIRFSAGGPEMLRLVNYKIGLGTTTPSASLHLKTDTPSIKFEDTSGGNIIDTSIDFHSGAAVIQYVDNPGAQAMYFKAGQTGDTRMTILKSNGNVGIGTTGPSEKLMVNGNISTTSNYGKIGFNVGNDYNSGLFPHYGLGRSSGSNSLVNLSGFYGITFGANASEKMRISNSGAVGINTAAPNYFLHIKASADNQNILRFDHPSATGAGAQFGLDVGEVSGSSSNNGALACKVEFGGTLKTAYKIHRQTGETDFFYEVSAPSYNTTSDIRYKKDIDDLQVKPINAKWKTYKLKDDVKEKTHVGVIAQELEEEHPEFVSTNFEGKKSVNYIELLVAKNAELEARIKQLENLILNK